MLMECHEIEPLQQLMSIILQENPPQRIAAGVCSEIDLGFRTWYHKEVTGSCGDLDTRRDGPESGRFQKMVGSTETEKRETKLSR